MLLKTAFHGVAGTWFVFADVRELVRSLKSQNYSESKPIKPSRQLHIEFKPAVPSPHHDEFKQVETERAPQHHYESKHVESPQSRVSPDVSLSKKKRKKKLNCKQNVGEIDIDEMNMQPNEISKPKGPNNKKISCKSEEKGTRTTEDVSQSQLNNVPELLSQHDPLNFLKEIKEDIPLLKSDNTAKKRKTSEGGRKGRTTVVNASPLPLENAPEPLLSQNESLNIVERQNEIEEDVASFKSEKTSKKRKISKAKSSGAENQDLSSRGQTDDQKADETRHIRGELSLVDDVSRPEESVETISGKMKKRSRNKNAVPELDPPGSPAQEQPPLLLNNAPEPLLSQNESLHLVDREKEPDEAVVSLMSEKTSKKSKISKAKSSGTKNQILSGRGKADDQKADETRHIRGENSLVDVVSRSEESAETVSGKMKKRSRNKNAVRELDPPGSSVQEQPPLALNNAPEQLLSQNESLHLVGREKEIEEDVTSLMSEKTSKKSKISKAKSSGTKNQNLSGKGQTDDKKADETRHIRGEFSLVDDVSRPEESVETVRGKMKKRSRKKNYVSELDPPGSPAQDQPPLALKNAPEPLLSQNESLHLADRKKEIEEDVASLMSEKTSKKSKTRKAKSSGTKNQDLSSNGLTDDEKADETRHIRGELSLVNDVSRPEESVETVSGTMKKRSRNNNDVPELDPAGSPAQEQPPLPLNNAPESLLSQNESLHLVDREEEIEKDVASLMSEKTSKKSKISKAKSSGAENQDLSSRGQTDDQKADETRHIRGELSLVDDVSRPEESVETISGKMKKRSRNKNAVPELDPPGSPAQEQPPLLLNNAPEPLLSQNESLHLVDREKEPDEAVVSLMSEKTSKKSKISKAKSSGTKNQILSGRGKADDQKADETRHIRGENSLVDVVSRSEESAETVSGKMKKRSRNKNAVRELDPPGSSVQEQPPLALNNAPEQLLSQNESLHLVGREKEIEEDVTSLMSEKTSKKSKISKAKSSGTKNQNLSGKGQTDDKKADETRHIRGEFSLVDDVSRPEESVETVRGKMKKRSRKKNYVSELDPPGSPAQDQPPLALKNAPEPLLSQNESLHLADRKKEIEEDVASLMSEKTSKKSKTRKAKSSGTKNQDLSSNGLTDDEKADETRHIRGELSLVNDVSRPEESVETVSGTMKKRSRNNNDVPELDPAGSPAQEQPPLPLNNAPESLLSQNESLHLVDREEEIEKDVASLMSEKTSKKSKISKAKSSGADNQDLSSRGQTDDQKADETRHIRGELSLEDDVSRPEESLETASRKTKKSSRNKNAVPELDPLGSPAQDQSPLALKNAAEPLLSQNESLYLAGREKEIEEDVTSLMSEKTSKKSKISKAKSSGTKNQKLSGKGQTDDQKADETRHVHGELSLVDDVSRPEESVENVRGKMKKRSRNKNAVPELDPAGSPAQEQPPLRLINAPESLLSQNESLHLVDREKEIEEDVASLMSEKTSKKSKTRKAKSSGTEIQDLSSNGLTDDHITDETRNIHGETSLGDHVSRPEESMETVRGEMKKRSRNRKAVPELDPPGCPAQEQPDEEMREMADPVTVIRIEGPKKSSQKKQPVSAQDSSSLPVNKHIEDAPRETYAPKTVEQVHDILIECDTNDAALKSEKTAKKSRTKANEQEYTKNTEDTSPSHPNNVPELLLSQDVSLNSAEREKEIGERKGDKAKSLGQENGDLSSTRQNDDKKSGETRHVHGELSLPDDIIRSEDSVETMSGKLKKSSRNRRAVPVMDPDGSLVKEHSYEEITEMAAPVNVIQGDKPKNQQPVPAQGLSSLPVNQHLNETTMEMDTAKMMEQTDDLLTKRENDDAKNVKVIQHEGDQDGLSEMPALKVPSGLVDLRSPEKPRPSKQGAKKLERVLSVETSSNRQNLVGSKKDIGSPKYSELQKPINYQKNDESMTRAKHSMISKVMDTLGPLDDHTNTFGKAGVSSAIAVRKIHQREKAKGTSKTLEKNSTGTRKSSRLSMRETVNASAQKKGFASSGAIFEDGSSSSSDDEHRSSNVTLPPDDLSSSDYSEGESQGVVISQHDTSNGNGNGNGRSKTNASDLKLKWILRSSSRYKKAKLLASQSQDESQDPEFVPDSQANM
ncbi:hypothetical protein BVRB_6g147500 isoform A [Beta vulgaris subsp. vulgaris]|nr:hypothetical protein BVRB_6g147500 isoform A [Beta vulgaris subsp. vulgaris]